MRKLSIKKKVMEKRQEKTSSFIAETLKEVNEIIGMGLSPDETRERLAYVINLSIKQSFLNGIEVGLRKRQKGQDRQNRKPYRKYRK